MHPQVHTQRLDVDEAATTNGTPRPAPPWPTAAPCAACNTRRASNTGLTYGGAYLAFDTARHWVGGVHGHNGGCAVGDGVGDSEAGGSSNRAGD